ncbi:MAG: peptidoglycan DD-metalloendopeptidase family protein [Paracoccaceae bacterium]
MSIRLTLLLFLFVPGIGFAQSDGNDVATSARDAANALEAASLSLQDAETARDRVGALTDTVRAYESGLEAMRDGLRRVTIREEQLDLKLRARDDEIAQLMGVLLTIGAAPPPALMLHPNGPTGSARSGMILSDVTPTLNAKAAVLRQDIDEMRTLRQLQQSSADDLQSGLQGVQDARTQLSDAIANRTDLPRRFTEDPVRTAILIASTETLDGFASGLSQIATDANIGPDAASSIQKGTLAMPVRGRVLHRAGQTDAAGITRPGIVVATRPRALVTSPSAATIRYLGPLLELGNVVILEPQADLLIVLAGLDQVFGQAGEVVREGAPVGLMGGETPNIEANMSLSSEGTGTERSETLYIELREGKVPVDPETWFQTQKDG